MNDIEKMRIRTQMNSVMLLTVAIEGMDGVKILQRKRKTKEQGKFDDIRAMNRQELIGFIRAKETRAACDNVRKNRYTPEEQIIASRWQYAQSRAHLLSNM